MIYRKIDKSRRDGNQKEIVAAIEAHGGVVQDLSGVGGGCPDIMVGWMGITLLMEIKRGKEKPRPNQLQWYCDWPAAVYVVNSIKAALWVLDMVKGGTVPREVPESVMEGGE